MPCGEEDSTLQATHHVLDARKILKIETQELLSLKGTPPSIEANGYHHKNGSGRLVAHLSNEEVVSNPSPGEGH
ncbi:hypothetical protein JHK82_034754 [Glycine max]|nr:hypothetical protein JHK85_035472 [Glycine max]KAG4987131.1 hypothetical protein JHK86_034822 [Glycine max]KAG5120334.1 hypothetical protein JHK82_034754 [Glycine max]KAG5141318.1 hypothetical protein JHK84_035086 [Glycine max]